MSSRPKTTSQHKINLLQLKPVTPYSLFSLNDPKPSQTAPIDLLAINSTLTQAIRPKPIFNSIDKPKKLESPLPEFIKEYVQGPVLCKNTTKNHTIPLDNQVFTDNKYKSRVSTSKPSKQRDSDDNYHRKSKSSEQSIKNYENSVFRLYKPQIIQFSPRSNIKLYSTFNLTQKKVKKKPNRPHILRNVHKPIIPSQKNAEDDKITIPEPKEYLKPALTFGEKLWRLNEISIFNQLL